MNTDDGLEFYEPPEPWGERYAITRGMVYKLLAAGLPSIKVGRARRIPVRAADEWMRANGGGAL